MNNDNSTISPFLTFPCFASLTAFTFKSHPLFSLVSLHCHITASLFLQYYDFLSQGEPMLSPARNVSEAGAFSLVGDVPFKFSVPFTENAGARRVKG